MTLAQELCHCVRNRWRVKFEYDGAQHTLNPHIVYEDSEGKIVVAGLTSDLRGWGTFNIDRMGSVAVQEQAFDGDTRFDRRGFDCYRVLCQIDPVKVGQ